MTTIAVTGATGGVGGRVARLLAERGVAQRLIVRDAARAPELAAAEVTVATYADGEAARRALEGVDVLFLVSAAENADRLGEHRSIVEAARASGVAHVVYTSFFGAAPDATFTLARDHFVTENLIRDAGLGHTFLRDNLYTDFLPMLAGEDSVIRGPAGTGRVASVTRDDVAESAVRVLLDTIDTPDAHNGITYELTGPEALTLAEVAAIVTAGGARGTVSYHDETIDEAYASRAVYDAPQWQLDAWVSTYTAIAAGELERVTSDVERLTGHPARSLREFLASAPH
ncbi:MAG: SDR family oxidoreductase [Herbiconiux sp.]|uniref:SDR family oxidoreductase n=1 Tax=Herbiconiux sp. TaxID=1871186 RepID=UPI0012021F15|nr:SDR family oxidoreductase [Herbiconiux sp.]TAJ48461.1 MAG: SDR family oxidoreductase [Herbiconiux sp.]